MGQRTSKKGRWQFSCEEVVGHHDDLPGEAPETASNKLVSMLAYYPSFTLLGTNY